MRQLKFKCESIKTPKYFALSHDNIGKLLMNKVKWKLRIFCLGGIIRWFDFDGFRLNLFAMYHLQTLLSPYSFQFLMMPYVGYLLKGKYRQ